MKPIIFLFLMFLNNLCLGQKVFDITDLSWNGGKIVAAVDPNSYWKNDPRDPEFIFRDSTVFLNGKPFTGKATSNDWYYSFVKGKLEGKTRTYWDVDTTIIANEYNFKGGVLNGEWFYYNNNESLAMKGNYTNGLEEGEEIAYYSTNDYPQNPGAETMLWKGNRIKGLRTGEWIAFDRSQIEVARAVYDNGTVISCSGDTYWCDLFKKYK